MSKPWLIAAGICLVAATLSCADSSPPPTSTVARVPKPPPPPPDHTVLHEIQSGETLSVILDPLGLSANEVRTAALPILDLARIRAGRVLTFKVKHDATAPHEIHYPVDEDNTLVVIRAESGWSARLDTTTYDIVDEVREFIVERTFWGAATEAGLRPRDIANLAEVFQYDVDFNTELRAGASVRMIVQTLYDGDVMAKLGRPLAVRFANRGDEYVAILHQSEDGETQYYDEKGVARKKAFLRSPLTFSRVTSGFNPRRYHPVLKRRRPHNGVDFGAPTGTPVRATGAGTVIVAGRSGGHGKFVKIDHPGPYTSSYSHLSKISVRKGAKIKQGQVIGRVGSTGMSTGPHLHYQFWVNGRYVNPMTIKLPRTQNLPKAQRPAFERNRDQWLERLDGHGPAVAMTED